MNPSTLAHASDPAVSHESAANLNRHTSQRLMEIVVDLIDDRGPLTPTELEHIYHHELQGVPHVNLRTVAKRVSDMKLRVGVLHGTGVRRAGAEALALTANRQAAIDRIAQYWERTT